MGHMLQVTQPGPPPALPSTPAPNVISTQALSARDVRALRRRGEELSRQIESATSRRRSTRSALENATGADKAGLEQRLGVLDARIARLEADIDANGRLLSSLEAARAGTRDPLPPFANINTGRNMIPIVIVFTLFVLSPIAVAMSRFLWRRSSQPPTAPSNPEQERRLERMEQAIDSIAIEMERVSEGQRFVTKLLAEGRGPVPVGSGQPAAQPIAVPVGERIGGR